MSSIAEMKNILNDFSEKLSDDDLGFVLTTIRDNTEDDSTYLYLDEVVKRLWDEREVV